MKPIRLKIKGLNSFTDSQEIDFEKLTSRGLFGIFGPTGSGKSTVLDGITLALYGEVARKSTNYINTGCDGLNVSFEFQISGNEMRKYRVTREFKRDPKSGSARTRAARIDDITGEGEVVLEEGAKTVTEKCQEIIGLSLDDFTRTVVLPQGKFSEFLKLEGRERRDMLERLFGLQKYGDDLASKLGSKIRAQRQRYDMLEGELKSFEEYSNELLETRSGELKETKEQLEECKKELEASEKLYKDINEVWELQKEVKGIEEDVQRLKENEGIINEFAQKVRLGESALRIKPYIDSYENIIKEAEAVRKSLDESEQELDIAKREKEQIEEVFAAIKVKKETELPELRVREQKISDAIEDRILLEAFLQEKAILTDQVAGLKKRLEDMKRQAIENEEGIREAARRILDGESRVEVLSLNEGFKQKANEGIIILNTYESLAEQKNKLEADVKSVLMKIEESKNNSEALAAKLNDKISSADEYEKMLIQLEEQCPGDQNTLLGLQDKISHAKEKWDKYKEYTGLLEEGKKTIHVLKNNIEINEKEKCLLEDEIQRQKDIARKKEIENMAHTLRENLLHGAPCPVCGSTEHPGKHGPAPDLTDREGQNETLALKEDRLRDLMGHVNKLHARLETELSVYEENEGRLSALGDAFKDTSVEELRQRLEKMISDINEHTGKKAELESKIRKIREEKNNLDVEYNKENTKLLQNREMYKKLREELRQSTGKAESFFRKLTELRTELGVDDLRGKGREIFQKEQERASVENRLKLFRKDLQDRQNLKERLTREAGSLSEDISGKNTAIYEKSKYIEEKENSIKNKAGSTDKLEELKNHISLSIKKINEDYDRTQERKSHAEVKFNALNSKIIGYQSSLIGINKRMAADKEALYGLLEEEGMGSIEEALMNLLARPQIDTLKNKIEEYGASLLKLESSIDGLKNKIKGRSVTEEQWIEVRNTKKEKEELLASLNERRINLETEIKGMTEKLARKKELLKSGEELSHRMSLLDDLEKLFKGKKFVEFVAARQLKYISVEAGRRLREITGGSFGLEVNESGKFLIRDYKSGGAERDASTLSGGETFVASLALALALSSQIQLKGTAPLELFFLDEGFGTLDDNLLEVVMDSLEKIHNDKLSIGIISHVESIKNRVPVKLAVTAAQPGMGGSRVKIEVS